MFMSQTQVSYEVPTSAVYERKFNTAIRSSFSKGLEDRLSSKKLTLDDSMIFKSDNVKVPYSSMSQEPDFFAQILEIILSETQTDTRKSDLPKKLRRSYSIVEKIITLQIEYVNDQNNTYLKRRINTLMNRYFRNRNHSKIVERLLILATWLIGVIERTTLVNNTKYNRLEEDKKLIELLKINHAETQIIPLKLVWSYSKIYINIDSLHYLLPKPCLLMIHNKLCDLVSVLVLGLYSEGTSMPDGIISLVIDLVKEMARLLIRFKTNAFTIFRCLEGIGIAETLVDVEHWRNTEFLDTLTDELYQEIKYDYSRSKLRRILQNVDIPLRHELVCLSKIVGHPLVDMESGSMTLFRTVNAKEEINLYSVLQCTNYIKENYIRNHIMKHGKWPPAVLNSAQTPKALQHSFIMNKDPNSEYITSRYGVTNIEHYMYVDLLPNMQFSKLENAIPYLKDKTISVLRSKVMKMYIDNELDTKDKISANWVDTRCLLAFLIHPSLYHNHIKFLDKAAYDPNLDSLLDYLVIRVVPKEKELKPDYRGFGCKTYEFRLGTLAQEKNVMRYLEEYSDEQAMTLGELDLLRRLRAFRNLGKAYTGYTILYIVIDSSKWNNRFRDVTVDVPMQDTLDKIFDYPIFSRTHQMYQKSLIYIPDNDETYWWDGQEGGIEGQNQDTWVVTYIAQLKTALHGLNVKYHILCKGDDVRIAVAIPNATLETTTLHDMKDMIVKRISTKMKDFGHVIKIEESYGSSRYFAFSKSASCDQVELPQGFRKIQKAYGASNAFIPTMDEYIAATFSNAHSACKTEPTVVPSYAVAVFWSLYYLMNHSEYEDCSDDEYIALLLTPNMVGGFPIIYLHNMVVRAESDLLSPYIGLMCFSRKRQPEVYAAMENFFCIPDKIPEDFTMLMRDPYALPSDRPTLPSSLLRSFITPALEKLSNNKQLLQLIRASKSQENNILIEILNTMNPLNTKVLSTMYSATPKGVLEELLRKFEAARSINELVILRYGRRKAGRMLRRIVTAERKLQRWRKMRLRSKNCQRTVSLSHLTSQCPAESASRVREFAWGKSVIGITMPPLQHQIMLYPAISTHEDVWANNHHFTFHLEGPVVNVGRDNTEHYTAGSKEPFVGYATRTGNVAPTANFIEHDPILTKVKNLLDLASWVSIAAPNAQGDVIESNAPEVIEKILGSYTDVPLNTLAPFISRRRAGTIQHHIRAPSFRESIVPNVLSNIYTRFSGESNSHIALRTSAQHYTINFLHCFCYGCWLMSMELEFDTTISSPELLWGVTTQCTYCNAPILETPIVFNLDLLNQVYLSVLSVTRIGEISESILQQSVIKLVSKNIHTLPHDVDITLGDASIGLMQEMSDLTYFNRMAVQDRYTGVHLSQEAYGILQTFAPKSRTRDIGLTELKRMHLDDIGDYLVSLIPPIVDTMLACQSQQSFDLLLTEMPGEELPWYGIVKALFESNKLGSVVRWMYNRSMLAPPSCYYSPSTAAKYIARACYTVYEWMELTLTCVVLSYYNSGILKNHIKTKCISAVWKVFRKNYWTYLKTFKPTNEDIVIQNVNRLIRESLVLAYIIDEIDTQIDHYCEEAITQGIVDFSVLDMFDIEAIPFNEWLENVAKTRIGHMLEGVTKRCNILNNITDELDDDELEDYVNSVSRFKDLLQVRLVYTTLEHCISKIRGDIADDRASIITDNSALEDLRPLPESLNLRPKYMLPQPSVDIRPTDISPIEYNYSPKLADLNNPIYDVDPTQVYRITGYHGGSETYYINIMRDLGLYDSLPRHAAYACIADGTGGASNVIATLCNEECTIMFHTKPDQERAFVYPENLFLNHPHMTDRVLFSHIHEGYTDLTSEHTWKRFEDYNLRYPIIICDAEISDDMISSTGVIYQHLVCFFLRNRHPNGLLICRLNMVSSLHADVLTNSLVNYCTYVRLYMPQSLKRYKWCYLIAYGVRDAFTLDYGMFLPKKDPTVCARVQSMQTSLLRRKEDIRGTITKVLNIHELDTTKIGTWMTRLGYRIEDILRNFLGFNLILPNEETMGHMLTNLRQNFSVESLNKYGINPEPIILEWYRRLNLATIPRLHRTQTWTTNTQAHRLHVIRHLMKLLGFYFALKHYTGINEPYILVRSDYVEFYQSMLQQLPIRDQYGGNAIQHLTHGFRYGGIEISFGCPYIRGIHAFLCLYGSMKGTYTRMIRIQEMRTRDDVDVSEMLISDEDSREEESD